MEHQDLTWFLGLNFTIFALFIISATMLISWVLL